MIVVSTWRCVVLEKNGLGFLFFCWRRSLLIVENLGLRPRGQGMCVFHKISSVICIHDFYLSMRWRWWGLQKIRYPISMGQHYHLESEKTLGGLCINCPNLRGLIFNPLRFKKDKFLKELKLNKIKNGEFVGLANFYFI